jgi:hypothetical protein
MEMLVEPLPRTESTPRATAAAPATGRSPLVAAFALAERLDALAGLIHDMSAEGYSASADPAAAPFAWHVCRVVDHLLALLDRPAGRMMTYDEPRTGRALARDRRHAIAVLRGLAFRVRDMAPRTADVPITVDAPLERPGARIRLQSSLGRELVFVLHLLSAAERVTEARCAS